MSIINNLRRAHAAIVLDLTRKALNPDDPNSGMLGAEINKMAVDALTRGIGSEQWTEYMRLYASNADELARLSVENQNDEGWLRQLRAYIVSNAICDIGTHGKTTERVDSRINIANDQEDQNFIALRRVAIPPLP